MTSKQCDTDMIDENIYVDWFENLGPLVPPYTPMPEEAASLLSENSLPSPRDHTMTPPKGSELHRQVESVKK